MIFENTLAFAQDLDAHDSLSTFRSRFHIPLHKDKEAIYLCGNSLGLQPKSALNYLQQEMDDWQKLAVEAHLHGKNPWVSYHKLLTEGLSRLSGACPEEVVAMNGLTVNLHLLFVSFYQPSGKRFKILTEENSFSSDLYALASQVSYHGFDPDEAIIKVKPSDGYIIRTEDILRAIEDNKEELAMVFFSGVNYLSGQVFDMETITRAGHKAGAKVGFDLAHAIGNIQLDLHRWEVDFAAWCSYKYLNSGPGGTAGAFIHENHLNRTDIPRFHGWWGHREIDRFKMEPEFIPAQGADKWQLSNAPVLSMAVQKASLDIFLEAGIEKLWEKGQKLSGYLWYLLKEIRNPEANYQFKIISSYDSRGCQVSIKVRGGADQLFKILSEEGIMADRREPDIIRLSPVPLYNTFEEVYRVAEVLKMHCNYER
ncbi:MAG: kynureninase [Cytophagaceae bacterium]